MTKTTKTLGFFISLCLGVFGVILMTFSTLAIAAYYADGPTVESELRDVWLPSIIILLLGSIAIWYSFRTYRNIRND